VVEEEKLKENWFKKFSSHEMLVVSSNGDKEMDWDFFGNGLRQSTERISIMVKKRNGEEEKPMYLDVLESWQPNVQVL
jgi:hypothetical protein